MTVHAHSLEDLVWAARRVHAAGIQYTSCLHWRPNQLELGMPVESEFRNGDIEFFHQKLHHVVNLRVYMQSFL